MTNHWGTADRATLHEPGDEIDGRLDHHAVAANGAIIYGTREQMANLGHAMVARFDPAARHVHKFLDLSTAHLPQHICDDLSGYDGVVAYQTAHGWLLWVLSDPGGSAPDDGDIPVEVLTIQRYARHLGCEYVLLDADGDRVPALPTWAR